MSLFIYVYLVFSSVGKFLISSLCGWDYAFAAHVSPWFRAAQNQGVFQSQIWHVWSTWEWLGIPWYPQYWHGLLWPASNICFPSLQFWPPTHANVSNVWLSNFYPGNLRVQQADIPYPPVVGGSTFYLDHFGSAFPFWAKIAPKMATHSLLAGIQYFEPFIFVLVPAKIIFWNVKSFIFAPSSKFEQFQTIFWLFYVVLVGISNNLWTSSSYFEHFFYFDGWCVAFFLLPRPPLWVKNWNLCLAGMQWMQWSTKGQNHGISHTKWQSQHVLIYWAWSKKALRLESAVRVFEHAFSKVIFCNFYAISRSSTFPPHRTNNGMTRSGLIPYWRFCNHWTCELSSDQVYVGTV